MTFHLLTLVLPVCIMLHVTEEFLFPGGFSEWYQEWIPSKTGGVPTGYLVWINTLMIGVCVLPVWLGDAPRAVSIWYTVTTIAGINACFHIIGVFKLKKYSPGVITGTLLYLPLFVFSSVTLLGSGQITVIRAACILALAVGYHVFSVYRQGK
jgi:hypothetical protein